MNRWDREILRLLDANMNRAVEGIRVLEETARMLCNDSRLTGELKDLRHSLAHLLGAEGGLDRRMVLARDSENDVLREGETSSEKSRTDLDAVLRANARRAQEAVRSIEEYIKLVSPELSARCKRMRFRLYDVEKELTARVRVFAAAGAHRLGVYVIIDRTSADGLSVAEVAAAVSDAGAGTVVYRDKLSCDREFRENAERMAAACRGRDVTCLVNDRLDAAIASGSDGVQVGVRDLSPSHCRLVGGRTCVIGFSLPNCGIRERDEYEGADFLVRGAVSSDARGLETLREENAASPLPVVAMGDIGSKNACAVLECGIAGIGITSEKYELSTLAGEVSDLRGQVTLFQKAPRYHIG